MMRTTTRILAAIGLSVLLAACGGGGGGGVPAAGGSAETSGGSSTPPNSNAAGVRLLSAAHIQAQGLEDFQPNTVRIELGYAGDITELAGRSLYVYVSVPDRSYELGSWGIDREAGTLHVVLGGLLGVPVGTHTGTVEVRVCLDPACTTQLPNSPISIPYELEMKPGLKLTPPTLAVANTFGAIPTPTRVAVQPPFNGSWELATDPGAFSRSDIATRDGDTLLLTPEARLRPGTYVYPVVVRGHAPYPGASGPNYTIEKTLTVTYTVSPGALPYYLNPVSANHDMTVNDPLSGQASVTFVPLDGYTYSPPTATYVAHPAAANGNPQASQWLTRGAFGADYWVSVCAPGPNNCLPPGTYSAIWNIPLTTPAGVTSNVGLPVTMTIRP